MTVVDLPVVEFVVLAAPKGKARARMRMDGRPTFTPPSTVKAEYAVRAAWDAAGGVRFPDRAPLRVRVRCVLQRPPAHYRSDGESLSAAGRHAGADVPHAKPDVDNVAKLVMDALEGYAYRADVAVTDLLVTKEWGAPARTEVRVEVAA